jgi:hypothetical protein
MMLKRELEIVRRIYTDDQYGGLMNTVRVLSVALVVASAQRLESLRLKLGKLPRRT